MPYTITKRHIFSPFNSYFKYSEDMHIVLCQYTVAHEWISV